MSKNKFLVLDFDGVICNSDKECCLVAVNSWNKINHLKELNKFEEIDKLFYKDFVQLRPYIKGAKEYYLLMTYIYKQKIINVNEFRKFKITEKFKQEMMHFEKIFYEVRVNLKKNNYSYWIELNYIYKEVLDFVKSFFLDRFIILTLKDGNSVYDIIKSYYPKISKKLIYDFTKINNKLDGLDQIKKDFNLNKNEILFIDDITDHLILPVQNNYKAFLSNWNNPNNNLYLNEAKKNNIEILNNISELKSYL